MKIKKTKNYNLVNSSLLNHRSYLGLQKLSFYYLNSSYIVGFRNKFSIFNLKQIKNFIKKSLIIIYRYHYYNKKILFIGFPCREIGTFDSSKNPILYYSTLYCTDITIL